MTERKSNYSLLHKIFRGLRGGDLLADTPLEFHCKTGVAIYGIEYVTTESMSITFGITQLKENFFTIKFDSMLTNEGFCIKILHSGDKQDFTKIAGKIDDSRKIKKGTKNYFTEPLYQETYGKKSKKINSILQSLNNFFAILFISFSLVAALGNIFLLNAPSNLFMSMYNWINLILFLGTGILCFGIFVTLKRNFIPSKIYKMSMDSLLYKSYLPEVPNEISTSSHK